MTLSALSDLVRLSVADVVALPVTARIRLAGRRDTFDDVLCELGNELDPRVRTAYARNPAVDRYEIEGLASDTELKVRLTVARRWWLPEDVLYRLACDSAAEVRLAVARRHDLDGSSLARLTDDPDELVARVAARENARMPVLATKRSAGLD